MLAWPTPSPARPKPRAVAASLCQHRGRARRELAPTKQSLHECRDALRELRAAVLARQKAQDALADLNRERSIQRASSWARSGITAAMKFPKLFGGFSAWG